MIALCTFAALLALGFVASLCGRYLRRMRRQQTKASPPSQVMPRLYIVRAEPLDIREAQRRRP